MRILVLLLELGWVSVGALGIWVMHRQVAGWGRRALGFSFFAALFILPVAWLEGRWVHWSWIQPRHGEVLAAVESRLGVAEPWINASSDEALAILYSPPSWWIIPVFGQVVIWTGRDRRVDRWTVSWR